MNPQPIYDFGLVLKYLNKNYKLDEYQDFIGIFDDFAFKYSDELIIEINKIFNLTKEDTKLIINQWVVAYNPNIILDKYWNHQRPIIDVVKALQDYTFLRELNFNRRIYDREAFISAVNKFNNDKRL